MARGERYRLAVAAAPFWRRLIADLIDLALIAGLVFVLWSTGAVRPELPAQQFDWIDYTAELIAEHRQLFQPLAVITFACGAIYGIMSRALFAGTLGERLVGLRLVGPDGTGAGPIRALLHAVGTLAGLALLSLGYVWAAVDPRRQGLAEYVSGTLLVVGKPVRE